MTSLDNQAWRLLFKEARTHTTWLDRPVDDAVLNQLYDLLRMAPTAFNSQPARLVFVKSKQAKERLRPALQEGNVEKTMTSPVTAIVAYDTAFYDKMSRLLPAWPGLDKQLGGMPAEARNQMAQLSATLQGAYLILAARGLGLDCGPMTGFDAAKVDAQFFPDGKWKTIFLVNLGYGDATKLHPRSPRLEFTEACQIA